MGFNTTNKNGLKTTWGECACDELRCVHWNNWDMASIPRIEITDSMDEEEVEHFERYNENCEAVELLWIELEIKRLEHDEEEAKAKRKNDGRRRINGGGKHFRKGTVIFTDPIIERELYGISHDVPDEVLYRDECLDHDFEQVRTIDTLYDNQGAVDAVRYDDDFDFDDSHR